jgi:hypothetical protein
MDDIEKNVIPQVNIFSLIVTYWTYVSRALVRVFQNYLNQDTTIKWAYKLLHGLRFQLRQLHRYPISLFKFEAGSLGVYPWWWPNIGPRQITDSAAGAMGLWAIIISSQNSLFLELFFVLNVISCVCVCVCFILYVVTIELIK